jgi:hypothetical protein
VLTSKQRQTRYTMIFYLIRDKILTLGGIIIGVTGGKNGIGVIIGIWGGKDILISYIFKLIYFYFIRCCLSTNEESLT